MPNQSKPTLHTVKNKLLRALPAATLERILPSLGWEDLVFKAVVLSPDMTVINVLFVESGLVSMIAVLEDGMHIEVGMVGLEGMVGLPVLLGNSVSEFEGLIQLPGMALSMPASDFQDLLRKTPAFLQVLLRYVDAFHIQVSRTAACNAHHRIEQRLARWLLMTHDRAGADSFPFTQEFMSTLLGVQRPGVTLAMGALRHAGLVQHERGVLHVLDRPGLEAVSCECYALAQRRFA